MSNGSSTLFARDGRSMARDLTTIRYEGRTFFRYSSYDSPFWARNNRSDGRWNITGHHATQYLAADPDGAWAELLRHESLHTEEEVALVRMQIWAVSLDQAKLVDYSTFEKAEAAGFSANALINDDWNACQEEGERLRELNYSGVVAPSAALPGALNITIFGRRIRTTWGQPTRLASAIPACVVAVGAPPPGLAARVRHYGEPHAGYDLYLDQTAEDVRRDTIGRIENEEMEMRVREPLRDEEDDLSSST